MITNNTEERKVTTLVDRLEGEITRQAMQFLLETRREINILEKDIEEQVDSEDDDDESEDDDGDSEDDDGDSEDDDDIVEPIDSEDDDDIES